MVTGSTHSLTDQTDRLEQLVRQTPLVLQKRATGVVCEDWRKKSPFQQGMDQRLPICEDWRKRSPLQQGMAQRLPMVNHTSKTSS